MTRIGAKVLDLKDSSRRNNIRITGIPESVTPDSLRAYLMDLMAFILPSCTSMDLTINRIHHNPKPKILSPHLPQDVNCPYSFFPH